MLSNDPSNISQDSHLSEINPLIMVIRDACPRCGSRHYKKNGHIYCGKQNHRCKTCGRQFVREFAQRRVSAECRALVERLLKQRPSFERHVPLASAGRGGWAFRVECYQAAPARLNVRPRSAANHSGSIPWRLKRTNAAASSAKRSISSGGGRPWRPGAAKALLFRSGKSSRHRARPLGEKLPALYRQRATFYTDAYAPDGRVLPRARHRRITKAARKANRVERFNGPLRPRPSRLVTIGVIIFKTFSPSPRGHPSLHLRL